MRVSARYPSQPEELGPANYENIRSPLPAEYVPAWAVIRSEFVSRLPVPAVVTE
jgi:hypothetical protein